MTSWCNGRRRSFLLMSPIPFVLGFILGIGFIYIFTYLKSYDDFDLSQQKYATDYQRIYYFLNFTKKSSSSAYFKNVSMLCVIFIDDVDNALAQRNAWRQNDSCSKIVYVGQNNPYIIEDNIDWIMTKNIDKQWEHFCHAMNIIYNSYSKKYKWLFIIRDNIWPIHNNIISLINILETENKQNFYIGSYLKIKGGNKFLDANSVTLFNWITFKFLMQAIGNSCNIEKNGDVNIILDGYLRSLEGTIKAVDNVDEYGCTLFHTQKLSYLFDPNRRKSNQERCISNNAVTFGMDPIGIQMFYLYTINHIQIIRPSDLNITNIVPPQGDNDEWLNEAKYELQDGPLFADITQQEFNERWSRKRKIIL
ncbi:uncharacterized protein LOC126898434 [Daktulosphaira vitifoliae]|uniref:uncharacterized protein LOC126898434 n=1 Tax=Daktulosphaira vitifoliae TaxID=58002 RepID=UPI0021AA0DD4|nr:uncharacterized protein LOC126898434 [Daktulosphaira vitifoliae]